VQNSTGRQHFEKVPQYRGYLISYVGKSFPGDYREFCIYREFVFEPSIFVERIQAK